MKTVVIFRKWPESEGGDVLALFPEEPADNSGSFCNSYMHVGQHDAAEYRMCIKATVPATPREYRELAAELRKIGYKLDIRKRATSAMRNKRMEAARC